MRDVVAKRIRKECYGDNVSGLSMRKYSTDGATGTIHAHPIRKLYQEKKRAHTRGPR